MIASKLYILWYKFISSYILQPLCMGDSLALNIAYVGYVDGSFLSQLYEMLHVLYMAFVNYFDYTLMNNLFSIINSRDILETCERYC
jgi:hypothetical protein